MKTNYSRFRTTNENYWEEKCFKERKDFITYVCENDEELRAKPEKMSINSLETKGLLNEKQ